MLLHATHSMWFMSVDVGPIFANPLVRVENFGMSFGRTEVFQDLSFEIHRGETFGFLGSNGSGKNTTIRAKTLLVGKVISLFAIGFVQMLVFAVPIAVGYMFLRDKVNIPDVDLSALEFRPGAMIIGALLLLASFSLFIATLVAIGAAMPTVKDAAPFFTGVVLVLFLPLYVVSLIVTSSDAPVVQVFTLFPYTAPVTALLRNALGSLPLWMAVVDIVVLFGLAALVLQIAVGIFKYGSIEYGKKVSLKAAFAARGGGQDSPR